ncbi:exodeoxyribonuclease VII large subunit [Polaromonas naphthalenivorans]|uniref:Exodeoxyribonuclease VII large subunit n=1 Tax=Polaromonas naphthalenivorans (strain CJ2) TaxID=365044 RepID=A1VWB4_POLNA|nr:exodeoxyribonuclease VII large subunit [Polaromonas naphthalenivorans]ABM39942.1 Exodeoxyribonuclease VII large subunit [Polaromonas naphthalenivorans CJ2]
MANIFLTVPFKDKDAAKGLGARWDAAQRQWFVPDGRELAPFALWLPAGLVPALNSGDVLSIPDEPGTPAMPVRNGVSLSSLLGDVSRAVAQAYKAGVWTLVEVVELRANGGHVYLEVSERDAHGAVLAKARAVIWQSTASAILPEFERATGAQLAPGIKLLVRARPVFKAQYGFSLDIDAIDPAYTLGELEARKRDIRTRLQAEGVFAANKNLPPPWDFHNVLVVSPMGGAGLGDFQAEADRLQAHGICRFTYALSRFQGEGAPAEIRDALQAALGQGTGTVATPFDAVVIIRGGGAVNDLAWLNDYSLARLVCDLPIPVLTGIGHERDTTLLDEVAHARYDTPSKVIAGIEQRILQRVDEVKANFEQVSALAARASQAAREQAGKLDMTVRLEALRHLAQGRQAASQSLAAIRIDAMQCMRSAAEQSRDALQAVKTKVLTQLADAKRGVPALWSQIALGSEHALRTASAEGDSFIGSVLERARQDASRARQVSSDALNTVSNSAKLLVRKAATDSQALIREIAGQGPEKTLQRGFAIVRNQSGKPLTRALQARDGAAIEIEFQDGRVAAITQKRL